MEQAKLDKIRRALARMDDGFWENVVRQLGAFEKSLQTKTDELLAILVKVQVAQGDILSARMAGFKEVVQAADNAANAAKTAKVGKVSKTAAKPTAAAIDAIVTENAAKLAALLEVKRSAFSEYPHILADIQAIFDEAEKLGEAATKTNRGE